MLIVTAHADPGKAGRGPRLESVDLLRGLVMVIMALDHTRDYFGVADNPTDVTKASAALFFTRWITHICAPTFFLLAGIFAWEPARRRSWLLKAGAAAILAFVAIRALNVYGDPAPWKAQAGGFWSLRTIASFINTTKYPPSLLCAALLLRRALLPHSRRGRGHLPRSLRLVADDVRVPRLGQLPVHAPA